MYHKCVILNFKPINAFFAKRFLDIFSVKIVVLVMRYSKNLNVPAGGTPCPEKQSRGVQIGAIFFVLTTTGAKENTQTHRCEFYSYHRVLLGMKKKLGITQTFFRSICNGIVKFNDYGIQMSKIVWNILKSKQNIAE